MKPQYGLFFLVWGGLLAGGLFACQSDKTPEGAEIIRPVRTQAVTLTNSTQVRTFSGFSKSGLEAKMSFKVQGTVKRLNVKVGDRIRGGQVLGTLDANDYRLEVQRAEAALIRSKAQERNARAEYDRVRALYENRNASRNDLDQARAAAESSRASVQSDMKGLEIARLRMSYTKLISPGACSVAAVPIEVNENVQAGQTILEVVCGSRLEIEVAVPELFIARVVKGSDVSVAIDSMPGTTLSAVVTKVGVSSGRSATTFPVTVQLREKVSGFRSGLAAQVTFVFAGNTDQPHILVPSVAVGEDREGRYVYVVEAVEEGIAIVNRTSVTVGELRPDGIEILDGIQDGQRIVTAGVRRLHHGQKVRIPPPANSST